MGRSKDGEGELMARINKLLRKISHLGTLDYGNQEYTAWHYEVRDTLEALFGMDSVEYRRFTAKWQSWNQFDSELERQARYLKKLDEHRTDLMSIIQRQGIKKISERKKILQRVKSYLILKPWHELKDFIATIIAKFLAEKSK